MLLQAMADQFGVPVTEYADVAFEAELAPKFSYGCAVFLDTDRVNFQKEGFSKEELLAGLAQVLPKNVWQYVVQIPRMAALGHEVRAPGRHAVQPRRASRRRSTTSRSASRAPRCSSTRTPARPAPSAPRWRRSASSSARGHVDASSASMPRSTSSTRRRTTRRRVCHFCPNNCKRTFIDTKRPDGIDQPLHRRLLLREGHRRDRRRRCSRSSPSARRSPKQFPNLVDYEAKQRLPALLRAGADARATARRSTTSRSSKGFFGMRARRRSTRPFQRSSSEALGRAPPRAHRHPARAQHLLDGAVLPHVPRGARHPEAERRLQRRDHRGDVGRGRQVRLDRSLLPVARSRRRTSTTCSSTSTREKKPLKYIFFPILTHVPNFVDDAMDNDELPDRRRRARRDEGGLHQGDRLLRRRAASSTSIRRSPFVEPTLTARRMFETFGPAPRHHRGRERLRLPTRRWKALDAVRARPAGEGPRHPRDGRGARTASRSS